MEWWRENIALSAVGALSVYETLEGRCVAEWRDKSFGAIRKAT